MKIAFLTTDYRDEHQGHSNDWPSFGAAPEALLQGFAKLPGVEVHIVSCTRQPLRSPEKIAPNLWYHSLLVPKIGWLTTGYQGTIRTVRRKLREIQPDIVHGQGTEKDCSMSAIFSSFPNVLTIHGNMAQIAKKMGVRPFSFHGLCGRLEDFALARTSGVFCNSAYTEEEVKPRAKKTWRVPNPLRLPFFEQPVAPSRETFPCPTLINVGTVNPLKRQVDLLDMARELHREGHRFQFLFAGGFPTGTEYAAAFTQKIGEAEKEGYGAYVGVKSVKELVDLFDRCDAMVHFSAEESFGLVVAESLARNLKFFGGAIGGIVDIASGVELAELHPGENCASLKQGIIDWLNGGCPKPTQAAQEIRRRYFPTTIAQRHLEIYQEVLGKRPY